MIRDSKNILSIFNQHFSCSNKLNYYQFKSGEWKKQNWFTVWSENWALFSLEELLRTSGFGLMNNTLNQLIEIWTDLVHSPKISCQCVIELVLQVSQPQFNVWMSKFPPNHNEKHDNVSTMSTSTVVYAWRFFSGKFERDFSGRRFNFFRFSLLSSIMKSVSVCKTRVDIYAKACKQIEIFSCLFFVWLSMQLNGKMKKKMSGECRWKG